MFLQIIRTNWIKKFESYKYGLFDWKIPLVGE